jgi:uncharacterized protein YbaP (TraB family)
MLLVIQYNTRPAGKARKHHTERQRHVLHNLVSASDQAGLLQSAKPWSMSAMLKVAKCKTDLARTGHKLASIPRRVPHFNAG